MGQERSGQESASGSNRDWLVALGKLIAVVIVGLMIFVVAQQTAAIPGGKLTVAIDSAKGRVQVGVEGGESIALQDVLREAWGKDESTSRGVVAAWGLDRGIIDVVDTEALERYELVRATDFWGLFRSLKTRHNTADKLPHINDLARFIKVGVPPEEREVEISWHISEETASNAILFPQGDQWFSSKLRRDCDIVVDDIRVAMIIHDSIRLTDPSRIQVSEGTFVRIANGLMGNRVMPTLRSREWNNLLKRGVVRGRVVC